MSLGVLAHATHARLLELLAEFLVELEAVTMTLLDVQFSICLCNFRARKQTASISAQSHSATHVGDALLLFHQVDDIMLGVRVKFYAIGIGHAQHITGKLDDHALHTQTDAEGGHIVLTAPLQRHIFALGASLTETRSDDDTVLARQLLLNIGIGQVLTVDIVNLDLVVVIGSCLEQCLVNALVGILQRNILAHQTDAHLLLGVVKFVEEVVPRCEVGFSLIGCASLLKDNLVEVLLMHHQGHLVDGGRVDALNDRIGTDVAELSHLAAHGNRDVMFGAEHQYFGLDTHLL